MSKHLQREMDRIRHDLLGLFGVVEQMIDKAVRSLNDRRTDLAAEVLDTDRVVDEREVRIEEECLKILALHQPVARDLRWLTTVIKVNGVLERMADLACNIAERAQALNLYPLFPIPEDLRLMVREANGMVRHALDAFVDSDSALAARVTRMDDRVDALNRTVIDELTGLMKEDSSQVEPALHCFSAARHLERIADLAENLAEDVIYLAEGEIVRHMHGVYEPEGKPASQ